MNTGKVETAGIEPAQGSRHDGVIWKFSLDPVEGGKFRLPTGSRLLDLQVQEGVPVMWWLVPDENHPPTFWPERRFSVQPTGFGVVPAGRCYIGTFQLGGFVGHVFSHGLIEEVSGA